MHFRRNMLAIALLSVLTLHAQTYNVMAFGAKGDGITDDAAAIQRTIDRRSA